MSNGSLWVEQSNEVYPCDPYTDRLLQFSALRQLGYPVRLERLRRHQLPQHYAVSHGNQEAVDVEQQRFGFWVRPVLDDVDFDRFIEDPDVPGDAFVHLDDEGLSLLEHHPVSLISHVDYKHPRDIRFMIEELEETGERTMNVVTADSSIEVSVEFMQQCFMAAYSRTVDPPGADRYYTPLSLEIDDIQLRRELNERGVPEVHTEQLGYLMLDYYRLVERLDPDFVAFKRPQ